MGGLSGPRRESLGRFEDFAEKSAMFDSELRLLDKTTCHDLNFGSAGRVCDEIHSVTQFDFNKVTAIVSHFGKKKKVSLALKCLQPFLFPGGPTMYIKYQRRTVNYLWVSHNLAG